MELYLRSTKRFFRMERDKFTFAITSSRKMRFVGHVARREELKFMVAERDHLEE